MNEALVVGERPFRTYSDDNPEMLCDGDFSCRFTGAKFSPVAVGEG
jgi:hypothetical protein